MRQVKITHDSANGANINWELVQAGSLDEAIQAYCDRRELAIASQIGYRLGMAHVRIDDDSVVYAATDVE